MNDRYQLTLVSRGTESRVKRFAEPETPARWAARCATWEPLSGVWVTADPDVYFRIDDRKEDK